MIILIKTVLGSGCKLLDLCIGKIQTVKLVFFSVTESFLGKLEESGLSPFLSLIGDYSNLTVADCENTLLADLCCYTGDNPRCRLKLDWSALHVTE